MKYENEQVLKAFKLYVKLALDGVAELEDLRNYLADDAIRALVEQFAQEVQAAVLPAGDRIYLVPLATTSPFHIKNAVLKKDYLGARAKNIDLYMMYVAIIILFGEFYDSYQTHEMTRDFMTADDWLDSMDRRMQALKEHDSEKLQALDHEFEVNWSQIVEKWDAMDEIRELTQKQDKRTISRMSFLNSVREFLLAQELVQDLGNQEITLTEKARTIIQRYYMEEEHNRGILEFLSRIAKQEEVR